MTYTDISICSQALLKLGADSITSFAEGTAESEAVSALYPLVRDSLLSSYPWSFATAQKRLVKLAENPLADYQNSYLLPNDFLRVVSAGSGGKGSGMRYRIYEKELHTDLSEVNLTYIFRAHESTFPAFFIECLVAKLASELCLPLTESSSRAEVLQRYAEDLTAKARLIDSQQATPKGFSDFVLTEVRK